MLQKLFSGLFGVWHKQQAGQDRRDETRLETVQIKRMNITSTGGCEMPSESCPSGMLSGMLSVENKLIILSVSLTQIKSVLYLNNFQIGHCWHRKVTFFSLSGFSICCCCCVHPPGRPLICLPGRLSFPLCFHLLSFAVALFGILILIYIHTYLSPLPKNILIHFLGPSSLRDHFTEWRISSSSILTELLHLAQYYVKKFKFLFVFPSFFVLKFE